MSNEDYYEENFIDEDFPQYPIVGAIWNLGGVLYEFTEEGLWVATC